MMEMVVNTIRLKKSYCLQSTFYPQSAVNLQLQSAVHGPQSVFCTDRFQNICSDILQIQCNEPNYFHS